MDLLLLLLPPSVSFGGLALLRPPQNSDGLSPTSPPPLSLSLSSPTSSPHQMPLSLPLSVPSSLGIVTSSPPSPLSLSRSDASSLPHSAAVRTSAEAELFAEWSKLFGECLEMIPNLYECQKNPYLDGRGKIDLGGERGREREEESTGERERERDRVFFWSHPFHPSPLLSPLCTSW